MNKDTRRLKRARRRADGNEASMKPYAKAVAEGEMPEHKHLQKAAMAWLKAKGVG